MAAAMNGMALHGGIHSLCRNLPDFLGLSETGASSRRADAQAGDLRADPRFDRAWRGRPDPSAGGAPGKPPRDAQRARLSSRPMPLRRSNAGPRRWLASDGAFGSRAHPPGPAGAARPGRTIAASATKGGYVSWRRRSGGSARRGVARDRIRGFHCRSRPGQFSRTRESRPRLARSRAGSSSRNSRLPGAESVLGGDAVRVGIEAACGLGWERYHRRRRRFHRHDGVRCVRAARAISMSISG